MKQLSKRKPTSDDLSERYVYGIRSGDLIKIGVTSDLVRRMAQIRELNPHAPHLVYYRRVVSAYHCERKMHEVLAEKLVTGEWFAVTIEEVRAAGKIGLSYAAKIRRQTEKRYNQEIDHFLTHGLTNINTINELH